MCISVSFKSPHARVCSSAPLKRDRKKPQQNKSSYRNTGLCTVVKEYRSPVVLTTNVIFSLWSLESPKNTIIVSNAV